MFFKIWSMDYPILDGQWNQKKTIKPPNSYTHHCINVYIYIYQYKCIHYYHIYIYIRAAKGPKGVSITVVQLFLYNSDSEISTNAYSYYKPLWRNTDTPVE